LPFSEEHFKTLIEEVSTYGHDRVLSKWKVWKAKIQLKGSPQVEKHEKRLDRLTQTYNQEEFLADLPLFTSETSETRPGSLVILDLDGFKPINDSLGHLAGNTVLQACASSLIEVCTGKGVVYRYGGDEFCLLLPNHSTEEAMAVAERILNKVRSIRTPELPGGLHVSVGVGSFSDPSADPKELFTRSDAAMYVSKKAGGDQVSAAPLDQQNAEKTKSSTLRIWEKLGQN